MKPVLFEMETSDPDDFLTLLFLADHPDVDLRAVLITPGGWDQCRLVRWALDHCGKKDVPIGTRHAIPLDDGKSRVSAFHYKVYGEEPRTHHVPEVVFGPALISTVLAYAPRPITYLVGSAPKNIGEAHRSYSHVKIERWVQQGGFAGDNIVAPEHRLAKFEGRITCPSFNPGGDPKSTLELLASDRIERRIFVSKNVCHGVVWTRAMHDQLCGRLLGDAAVAYLNGAPSSWGPVGVDQDLPMRPGLKTMVYGLDRYLQDKGVGKAMHDIVAAACVLDESVCTLKEVEIYRERGEWGAREKTGTGTWISVAFDQAKFIEVLAR